MIQHLTTRPEWYEPWHNEQLRAAIGAEHVCEHDDGLAALFADDADVTEQDWAGLVAGFTPAPREPSDEERIIAEARKPLDAQAAQAVHAAKATLLALHTGAGQLLTNYAAAANNTAKQTVILGSYDDVLTGLRELLEVVDQIIDAVVWVAQE